MIQRHNGKLYCLDQWLKRPLNGSTSLLDTQARKDWEWHSTRDTTIRSCEVKLINTSVQIAKKHKLVERGYGLLPERELRSEPFSEVAVDLIGPWKIKVRGRIYEFNALTAIDPVTNLVELKRISRKTSDEITRKFSQCWLSRYPWPERCIHDNGGEFTGWEFQELLQNANIADVPTSSYNPTANSVCERMHQTMGNILRTLLHGRNPPQNLGQANELIDEALAICQHALRSSVHTTLGSSPGHWYSTETCFSTFH